MRRHSEAHRDPKKAILMSAVDYRRLRRPAAQTAWSIALAGELQLNP
jgi:hypothetical protein